MLIERHVPFRYLGNKVKVDVPVVLGISTTGVVLNSVFEIPFPHIPMAIPLFMGTAISVLLSFKLSQSYDRWWEARKIWGAIVNDSRSLSRQVLSFPNGQTPLGRAIVMRQIAWCYCLGESLRGKTWAASPDDAMSADDVAQARQHQNRPLALLQQHARDLGAMADQGLVTDYQRIAVDETLSRLTDHMGKAERIRNTVFPITYRMFLHLAIYLFILLFTFSADEVLKFWAVPLVGSIATIFFFLEKTSTHMQDPFRDRPTDCAVTSIARTIEVNLRQLLGDENVPELIAPKDFYVM